MISRDGGAGLAGREEGGYLSGAGPDEGGDSIVSDQGDRSEDSDGDRSDELDSDGDRSEEVDSDGVRSEEASSDGDRSDDSSDVRVIDD